MRYSRLAVRQLVKAAAGLASGDPVPLHASLELTLRCNGDCVYCGSARAFEGVRAELDTAAWMSVIDDLAASGCVFVGFTGGEPLLRTDVEALASRAARLGLAVGLNTNGRLLEKKRSILAHLSRLTVSIDAVGERNDRIRGSGAFSAAVAAIRTARFAGVPVEITAVLSTGSVAGLPEFLSWLRDNDLRARFQPAYDVMLRSGGDPALMAPSGSEMESAVATIEAARRTGVVANSPGALRLLADATAPVACFGGRCFVRVNSRGCVEVCGLPGDPLDGQPCVDVAEGVVAAMKQIPWPHVCRGCPSAARIELNRFLSVGASGGPE